MEWIWKAFENNMARKTGQWIAVLLVLVWCALMVVSKINLATADIGRHIQNGSVMVHGSWQEKWAVLHTNFYSYTNASFPFVNHHWGSGVIFYFLHAWGGFPLLSVFYMVVTVATFFLFFRMAQKTAGSIIAILLAVLVLPIITSRREVRPEAFTYVLCGVFYWILWHWRQGGYGKKKLFLLPGLMLLWVNLHIGFIIGIGILGVFWLEQAIWFLRNRLIKIPRTDLHPQINNHNFRLASVVLTLTCLAAMVSPFGWRALLFPLIIFQNYGYTIVENQSVFFLERLGFGSGMYFGFFQVLVVAVFVSFCAVVWKFLPRFSFVNFVLILTFAVLATLAVRDFPLFGLFALPVAAYNISIMLPQRLHPAYRIAVVVAVLSVTLSVVLKVSGDYRAGAWQTFGFGLMPGELVSAEFFKSQNIQGPVFNNYDNGGYLIFTLWQPGNQSIFVDNRPEAYPVPFFQKDYIPAQNDPQEFDRLDAVWHFNAIYFEYHDATPWGQAFLVRMVKNPDWAPVFVDNYNLILLRRNASNADIIKKYELPKDMFGVSS